MAAIIAARDPEPRRTMLKPLSLAVGVTLGTIDAFVHPHGGGLVKALSADPSITEWALGGIAYAGLIYKESMMARNTSREALTNTKIGLINYTIGYAASYILGSIAQ